MDIDRAGFVPRETCYCEGEGQWWVDEGGDWVNPDHELVGTLDEGMVAVCDRCHAELAVFIDRAGFVERDTCYCNCEFREWRSEEDSYWYWDGKYAEKTGEPGGGKWFEVAWGYTDEMATGYVDTCRRCRAELAVFIDPDGTRHPMVRRAGFWRDVALDLSRILPRGKAELQWAVRRAMAADGLNAQAAGETMGAAERTEIQWSGKPGSEARE